MKQFYNYFNVDSIHDSVLNRHFGKNILHVTSILNVAYTILAINNTIDDVNTDGTLDSMGIELCNIIFNNCNRSMIIWISIDCRYNESINSKYNDFDGTNSNLAIFLSIINDIFSSSILKAIVSTETASSDTKHNKIYVHDNIFKVKSINWGNDHLKYLHTHGNGSIIYCDKKKKNMEW